MFNMQPNAFGKQRINFREIVDLETGEIIEKHISESTQQAAGIQHAKCNKDVPLYCQDVDIKQSVRITLTGGFSGMKRKEIVEKLNDLGLSAGGMNNKTTLLIIGTWGKEVGDDGVSEKYLGAIKRGVKLLKMETAEEVIRHFESAGVTVFPGL